MPAATIARPTRDRVRARLLWRAKSDSVANVSAKALPYRILPITIGMAATISTLLQAIGLAAHWLKKPSEKPRMMPTAVTEPLRKFVSMRSSACWLCDLRTCGRMTWRNGISPQPGSVFHRQMPCPLSVDDPAVAGSGRTRIIDRAAVRRTGRVGRPAGPSRSVVDGPLRPLAKAASGSIAAALPRCPGPWRRRHAPG